MTTLSVILGPTAAGKSALALRLADTRNLAIVSADSRQIYRRFDIGTAKPTNDERAMVPHYGIDVAEPTERYSAHQWARDARGWMADAMRLGRSPVVVGGTGFYIRALVRPLSAVPQLDESRRRQLEPVLAALDFETLGRWCQRLDPARAHLGRTQRLRAIETVLLSGKRLSEAFVGSANDADAALPDGADAANAVRYAVRYLVVDPGAVLRDRIVRRVDDMLRAGWIDEVRRLDASEPDDAPAWKASGYLVMRDAARGVCDLAHARERVIVETRQYAKRQRTWCRHQLTEGPVTHIDPTAQDAFDRVLQWWDAAPEGTE